MSKPEHQPTIYHKDRGRVDYGCTHGNAVEFATPFPNPPYVTVSGVYVIDQNCSGFSIHPAPNTQVHWVAQEMPGIVLEMDDVRHLLRGVEL